MNGDSTISLHDLASGLDASPDVAAFITSLLPSNFSDLDTSLNELLTRFTLLSQDTSSALEQSISDISRTVPRLNYDLQFMRESATTLQTSLNLVQGRVESNKIDKLAHLDKLKTRMESARDILREAESWSTLESEITSSIASSEWEKAGSRLAEAERSMVVFQSGEYESRRALLVSLQNGLETALSSALEQALEERDVEGCTRFYGVFESMGRESEYRNYYYTQRRRVILDEWASFDGDFGTFLPRFYAVLGRTVEREVDEMAIPGGKEVLSTFLQSTLESLSPSLQSRLGSMTTALPEIIKAYQATEEIAMALHAILERVTEVPRRKKVDIKPSDWETTLFESFLELQMAYGTLERRYLLDHLRAMNPAPLSERSISVFNIATEAIARCTSFTHGYGAVGLISALDEFIATFLEQSHSALDSTPVQQDELDLMDYSTEDWAAFQSGLRTLKVCRDISTRLDTFQEKLSPRVDNSSSIPIALLRQSTNLSEMQSSPRLTNAVQAMSNLTRSAQTSLSSIILSPLRTALSTYPSLPVWTQLPRSRQLPTFSLSPTDEIARVSEGLLNLLRVFEVYAKDPALAFSLNTLPHITESLPETSPELVLSTWISSLAMTLLDHLTSKTLPAIPRLTQPGSDQLAADLGYLGNAVRALDVEWAELELWREGVEVDEAGWRDRSGDIWTRIGRMRGFA